MSSKLANTEEKSKTPMIDAVRKELEAKKKKLIEKIAPYREFHDNHVNDKKFIEARTKIKEISAELGAVENELAAIARGSPRNINLSDGVKAAAKK